MRPRHPAVARLCDGKAYSSRMAHPMSVDICWETVCALPVNALITGNSAFRQRALAIALADTPPDVHFCRATPGTDLVVPEVESGTLVIDDADALPPTAQQSLLRWMEEPERQVRIITLAEHPLYPLVEQGRFSADLYYRLCVVQTSD